MPSYFVGIRLPEQLEDECESWRRAFKAPLTVAHITLIPPFMWNKDQGDLETLIRENIRAVEPFTVQGKGLGNFGKRVLFVNVELNSHLRQLQDGLAKFFADQGIPRESRRYRPHITLASRLNRAKFNRFQKQLVDYKPDYSFKCTEISVFEFSADKSWEETSKMPLGLVKDEFKQ